MSKTELRETFKKNLRNALYARDMTQKDFAKAVSVSAPTVNEWLKGKKMPRMDKIDTICNVLMVSRSDLMDAHEPAILPTTSEAPYKPQLTDKDERDIQKKLSNILDGLDSEAGLAYYNGDEPMDEETRELLRLSLENSLRMAKLRAKESPRRQPSSPSRRQRDHQGRREGQIVKGGRNRTV